MRRNITIELQADGKKYMAVLLPHLRHNGIHYEVNIKGFPRFFMKMTELGRYDIIASSPNIPYSLILAASDAIEHNEKNA